VGVAALAHRSGLAVPSRVAHIDVPLLLGVSVLTTGLFFRERLHRGTGVTLLAMYIAYIAYVFVRG